MFFKTCILKNFAIFTENACFGVFFNKITGLKACIFIKRETPTQVFFCEYCKIFKNIILFPVHYTFPKFYVMIVIRCFQVAFYYRKIRPGNRKNFTIDRSRFIVKRCFFLKQEFDSPSRIFFAI